MKQTDEPKAPAVYTAHEVQQMLRLGKNTVNALLRDGTIPSFRIGRRYFIPIAAFERFLDTRGAV